MRDPDELRRWLVGRDDDIAALVQAPAGAAAEIAMLDTQERLPWAGHSAAHALAEIYAAITQSKMTLIFVNTRTQAEFIFQQLWRINDDGPADRAASRLARRRPAPPRRGGDGERQPQGRRLHLDARSRHRLG